KESKIREAMQLRVWDDIVLHGAAAHGGPWPGFLWSIKDAFPVLRQRAPSRLGRLRETRQQCRGPMFLERRLNRTLPVITNGEELRARETPTSARRGCRRRRSSPSRYSLHPTIRSRCAPDLPTSAVGLDDVADLRAAPEAGVRGAATGDD